MIEIHLLNDFPHYAPILAYWSYHQWYSKRDIPFTALVQSYSQRAHSTHVPLAWVAINEKKLPVGMASLKNNDLWSRTDLNPWLASLYIVPEYRFQGIGNRLVRAIIAKSLELGYKTLYLFEGHNDTVNLIQYYTKRGFSVLEEAIDNDGFPTTIMYINL
ncbi:MAG: GNAT family N-acetyltransferase [Spirochaetota bacterium]